MQFASISAALPDVEPGPPVLPPVQSSMYVNTLEESEAESVAGRTLSYGNDDVVPPLVRFKNRYRRAQQLEELQQQHCETLQDWNHNELYEVRQKDLRVHCNASPSKILPDSAGYMSHIDDERFVAKEARPCEKRTWLHAASEVDVSYPWVSSSKIPCRDATVDSRGIDISRQSNNRLQTQYQMNLHYQNGISALPKCEPHSTVAVVSLAVVIMCRLSLCLSVTYVFFSLKQSVVSLGHN